MLSIFEIVSYVYHGKLMIYITINGQRCQVENNITILQACKTMNVYIPTLCFHEDLPASGKCGFCIVKVNGNSYAYACMQKVSANMIIETATPEIMQKARSAYKSFIDSVTTPPSLELEEIGNYLFPKNTLRARESDKTNSLMFDPDLCINCGRCIRMCSDIQGIGALNYSNPRTKYNECISCGQCISVCPTNALRENSSIGMVLKAIGNKKIMCLQIAPAVRVTIGEGFGSPIGTVVTNKIIRAARNMGFQYVFDTQFGADVTILEEGNELLERIKQKKGLPLFTSCCPAWVNYVERLHPELIPNVSTTKSPHMIVGRLVKSYFANKKKIDPNQMFFVSLMPCVAKKDEIKRMQAIGDVDAVLTSKEFIQMINHFGIEWSTLRHSDFDKLLGESTGAGAIFGTTGGVTESAIRYVHEVLTGKPLGKIEYKQFRGFNFIKRATIKIENIIELNIAVCNGISTAQELLESDKYRNLHFVEVMACSGGCIAGGGQPKLKSKKESEERAKGLFNIDSSKEVKVSSRNTEVEELYKTFLGKPGSPIAHEQLHTHFEPQETTVLAEKRRMQKMPIVGYGSASGTAMKLARIVSGFMQSSSVTINSLTIPQLITRKIAIFVISTIGDGEFPSNSRHFVDQLSHSMEDLSEVQFAVCGIGNKSYKHFCRAGNQLHLLLEQHLAKPILKFMAIDTLTEDRGEALFEGWSLSLCNKLGLNPPKIGIHLIFSLKLEDEKTILTNPLRPVTFEYSTLKSKTPVTTEGYVPKISLYSIKIPNGMHYEVGNEMEVLPSNPDDIVESVVAALNLDINGVYRLSLNDKSTETFIPERVSIRQLFTQYLDLCGPPSRSLLRCFLEKSNIEGTERLQSLLNIANDTEMTNFLKDTNVAKFIIEFVKYGMPPLDLFVSSCPQTKPRSYSIASSPRKTPNGFEIYVALHAFGENDSKAGLCSSYLDSLNPNSLIPMRIVKGTFGYPTERKSPIIFVCLGCGVGMALSYIRDRQEKDGPIMVVFGARNEEPHAFIRDKLLKLKSKGVIREVLFAWSRDVPGKNYYVQDAMKDHMPVLYEFWEDENSILYYCGGAGNVTEDLKEVMTKVLIKEGGLSMEEAMVVSSRHTFCVQAF